MLARVCRFYPWWYQDVLAAPFQQVLFFARMADQIRLEEMVTEARAMAAAWSEEAFRELVKDAHGVELGKEKTRKLRGTGQTADFIREVGPGKHLQLVGDGSLRAKLAEKLAANAENKPNA